MSSADRGRVVFLHSDVGDARMWAAQQKLLHDRFETIALDLHELGTRPGRFSFVELVGEQLPAILVGNSFGGRVALETALAFGDRVPRLVLADPGIGDHEWSQDMRDYLRREEELFDAGDVDAAGRAQPRALGAPPRPRRAAADAAPRPRARRRE